jgi:hypothetical protein
MSLSLKVGLRQRRPVATNVLVLTLGLDPAQWKLMFRMRHIHASNEWGCNAHER